MGRTLRVQTPLAFQQLTKPARYKGAHGGRGSGKSHFFAEQLLVRALVQPGFRAVCVRQVQNSLEQSVKRLLADKIQAFGLGGQFRVLDNEIRTPGDGLLIFQGMQNHNADSIKSLEGYDVAWVEEAQSLSQTSLDLLRPTIRKPGSELWFSWNPRNATDPVDVFLRLEPRPPGAVVVESNYEDNPWFPEVLRVEMEFDRANSPEKYAHVWRGKYRVISEATVFRNWRVEDFETPTQPAPTFYFGGDWGFSVDPTVLVRAWLRDPKTLMVDWEAYSVGCEIDDTPALFDVLGCGAPSCPVRRWLAMRPAVRPKDQPKCDDPGHGMARAWAITADSARPETISFMRRHGYPRVEPARKGPGSVEEGVKFLQGYTIIVHPRCKNTIDELSFYSYKVDSLTGKVLPILQDKKNHVIDSMRYSVEPIRKPSMRVRQSLWG